MQYRRIISTLFSAWSRTTLESIICKWNRYKNNDFFFNTRWENLFIARFVLRICYDCIHTRLVLLYNAIYFNFIFYSGNEMSTHPLINYAFYRVADNVNEWWLRGVICKKLFFPFYYFFKNTGRFTFNYKFFLYAFKCQIKC